LFVSLAAVALHVVVDGFLAPEPDTSAGDHLVSAGVPLLLLALAAWLLPRARPGVRAAVGLVLGVVALVGAGVAIAGAAGVGPRGDDWTGILLLVPAGLALLGLGVRTLWVSRTPGRHRCCGAGWSPSAPSWSPTGSCCRSPSCS
jgi:hypothetical protein